MRVRITGRCKRTGEQTRLEVDVASVNDAVSQASADDIAISNVSVLEGGDWVRRKRAQSAPPKSKGIARSILKGAFLTLIAFFSIVFPKLGALVAAIILLAIILLLVPPMRSGAQRVLGVNAERRTRSALRLIATMGYAWLLASLSWSGAAMYAAEAEVRAETEAANIQFETLVAAAREDLQSSSVGDAKKKLMEARGIRLAERADVAVHLLDRIGLSTNQGRIRALLLVLSDDEFESIATDGVTPSSLDLKYPVLTDGAMRLAKAMVAEVAVEREELAAIRAAKALADQEQAERDRELAEKEAIAAREREQIARKKAAEDRRVREKESRKDSRKKEIERQFSAWDGSHRGLEKYIKDAMNDPGSFEHDKTVYSDMGDHLIVKMSYRGKNGFGALVKNWVRAKVNLQGKVLAILDVGP